MSKRDIVSVALIGFGFGMMLAGTLLRLALDINLPGLVIAGAVCMIVAAVMGGVR